MRRGAAGHGTDDVRRCRNCYHFSSGEGRIKDPGDFCCISLTANSFKRDYPAVFKPDAKFPPGVAEFIEWPGKDEGCDFFKVKPSPAEFYNV